MQSNIRKIFFTTFGLLLFFLVPLFSFAQNDSQETIQSFQSDIVINTDGSTDVTETIVYDFGTNERHGMYREIPLTTVTGAVRPLRIQNISVTDEMRNVYTTNLTTGDPINIRIGDADRTITGVHTYVIRYHTENAIGFFDSFDELYWNATGNDWDVPIESARATITIPGMFALDSLRIKSYCGSQGSTLLCGDYSSIINSNTTTISFSDSYKDQFSPREGMTIAVGFPKGVITPAILHWWEKDSTYIVAAYLLGIFFVIRFFWWLFRSYIPEYRTRKKPIIAEYIPPEGITAGEAMCIYTYASIVPTPDIITTDVLYLASRGYLTIRKIKEKKHWWERASFGFTRTTKDLDSEILGNHLESLIQQITFTDKEKTFEDIENEQAYYSFQSIAQKIYKSADTKNGKIEKTRVNPFSIFKAQSFVGIIIVAVFIFMIFSSIVITEISFQVATTVLGVIVLLGILVIIKKMLLVPLRGKTDLWYSIAGLREYINIAEKDRINFASDPEKASQIFSDLLPFAVAFKLEKKWTALFEGILPQNPSWYQSSDSTFSAQSFSTSLTAFSLGMTANSVSGQPASSGSGSGGGGSSGGGGGGGGGGSW